MSGDEALALIVDAKLSRYQYNLIRKKDKEVFPSYTTVQGAKKKSYPFITVTESSAEVKLLQLLDHTAESLIQVQQPVIDSLSEIIETCLFYKWGFDGTSSFSAFKQKIENDIGSDESILFTSIVPVYLVTVSYVNSGQIIWQDFCLEVAKDYVNLYAW